MQEENRYSRLIEHVFFSNYTPGAEEIAFDRSEFQDAARELGILLPKNLGDIVYSFRYRTSLPESVRREAPAAFRSAMGIGGRNSI